MSEANLLLSGYKALPKNVNVGRGRDRAVAPAGPGAAYRSRHIVYITFTVIWDDPGGLLPTRPPAWERHV